MSTADVVTAVAVVVGLVGIVVPLLPGTLLIGGAVVVWAVVVAEPVAWTAAGVAVAVLAIGTAVKYLVPHRRLRSAGIPTSTVVVGGALGVVGFFVVPVLGLVLGFVLGVYLAELRRLGPDAAWPATKHAVRAVGLSLLIELLAGMLATSVWVWGALATG